MMRGHCGDNSWRLSTVLCHCLLSEMMPVRGRLCSKQSYTERIKWMPSVSSCLHLEQLKAERVIAEPQQAVSHELLMAFHSVCTTLCQCCACEPPSSTNWSKHSALLIAFGWSFWICVCLSVSVCLSVCLRACVRACVCVVFCKASPDNGKQTWL